MIELTLLNGHFEKQSAIRLLEALANVKVQYHEDFIRTKASTEEDIKMSENRIKAIERELKVAVAYCKASSHQMIDLTSSIAIG